MSLLRQTREVTLCYVTDRKALGGTADEQIRLLLGRIESVARAGVEWVQVREKDLSGRALGELVREALRRVPASCRIIVNDRLDVACTTGARGLHLGGKSLPVAEAKRFLRERKPSTEFLVGVSTHSLDGVLQAAQGGADYAFFGPVFATPSKGKFGAPHGIARLAEVCGRAKVPVVAIGGIDLANAAECMRAGASGLAAIRLFQESSDVRKLVYELRR